MDELIKSVNSNKKELFYEFKTLDPFITLLFNGSIVFYIDYFQEAGFVQRDAR